MLILNTASLVVVDREVVVYILEGAIKEFWDFKASYNELTKYTSKSIFKIILLVPFLSSKSTNKVVSQPPDSLIAPSKCISRI